MTILNLRREVETVFETAQSAELGEATNGAHSCAKCVRCRASAAFFFAISWGFLVQLGPVLLCLLDIFLMVLMYFLFGRGALLVRRPTFQWNAYVEDLVLLTVIRAVVLTLTYAFESHRRRALYTVYFRTVLIVSGLSISYVIVKMATFHYRGAILNPFQVTATRGYPLGMFVSSVVMSVLLSLNARQIRKRRIRAFVLGLRRSSNDPNPDSLLAAGANTALVPFYSSRTRALLGGIRAWRPKFSRGGNHKTQAPCSSPSPSAIDHVHSTAATIELAPSPTGPAHHLSPAGLSMAPSSHPQPLTMICPPTLRVSGFRRDRKESDRGDSRADADPSERPDLQNPRPCQSAVSAPSPACPRGAEDVPRAESEDQIRIDIPLLGASSPPHSQATPLALHPRPPPGSALGATSPVLTSTQSSPFVRGATIHHVRRRTVTNLVLPPDSDMLFSPLPQAQAQGAGPGIGSAGPASPVLSGDGGFGPRAPSLPPPWVGLGPPAFDLAIDREGGTGAAHVHVALEAAQTTLQDVQVYGSPALHIPTGAVATPGPGPPGHGARGPAAQATRRGLSLGSTVTEGPLASSASRKSSHDQL